MRMDHGIAWYRDVNSSSLKKEFGYLVPLRVSKSLSGPIKLEVDEKKIFTVGREHNCSLVLPQDMFEEDENLKHDKE